ncbi:MAG: Bax inhibitor-1/YccA family protein [Flavobacteriales bacterium]|nr:Bax inhibitor-1/YccA family protein [Flavobacteriales bacterium]
MEELIDNNGNYSAELSRVFFRNVYTYMFGALGISGILAYMVGTNELIFAQIFLNAAGTGLSPIFWIIAFAPVGIGLLIQMAYERLSMGFLLALFILYSGLMGLSLSSIFMVYNMGAIASTFFVAAGAFAGMAILGYTTKTDLTKFGSLLYMVFIGMFIAGIVNIFIGSDTMGFIIACIGVFVFTGLTAYQMQQLKEVSQQPYLSEEDRNKLSLIGGLQLYILFVNLFLSLLRILGSRD